MMPKAEAMGELHTALRSASITYGLVPSVPFSVLVVLPSSLQDSFADFETWWYNWLHTQRSNFSAWASTCSGQHTGNFDILVSELINATSSMDNSLPRGLQLVQTSQGQGPRSLRRAARPVKAIRRGPKLVEWCLRPHQRGKIKGAHSGYGTQLLFVLSWLVLLALL
ncbi:hypothetical protein LA080_015978 [Diaporthe eres]|nr:hypothetical protein LA080_015978 [Diaporthe eres]